MKIPYKKISVILGLLIVGFGVGWCIGGNYQKNILIKNLNSVHPIRSRNTSYKFIDPLLTYAVPNSDTQPAFASMENQITNIINTQKATGNASDISVSFYDLNRGYRIGVNDKDMYNPASMLKVVIMITLFKEAESDPSVLNKSLTYNQAIENFFKDHPDINPSPSELVIGKSYTTDDLINKMIINSDNGAEVLLLDNIDITSYDAIYKVLGISSPDSTSNFTISSRNYSLFFRILYNSTYLNDQMSEKALEILSQSTFKDGLVAGLPSNIIVAHKYGEYVNSENNTLKKLELHDCGIVYYSTNPYFLCVMTSGNDLQKLEGIIKNISSLVYKDYAAYK